MCQAWTYQMISSSGWPSSFLFTCPFQMKRDPWYGISSSIAEARRASRWWRRSFMGSLEGLEDDRLADGLAACQPVESLVYFAELDPVGQQPVDRQPPLTVEVDIARDVVARDAGAEVGAAQGALLGDEAD